MFFDCVEPRLGRLYIGIVILIIVTTVSIGNSQRGPVGSKVIYAVNVAGASHKDINGINYIQDPLANNERSAVIVRRGRPIRRVDPRDEILYQTYRTSSFGFTYKIPIRRDGSYVLVLQFCELSTFRIGQRAFAVKLDDYTIFPLYRVFYRAGFATAHQEVIPFTISDHTKLLEINRQVFEIDDSMLSLRFHGIRAPPIISAFYILNGSVQDVPKLLPAPKSVRQGSVNVVYAVNAGGKAHRDIHGIYYQEDTAVTGTASDDGLKINISGVPVVDAYLYQTERYAFHDFGYNIPIKSDGTYVLVLKFAEIHFHSPNSKVFSVFLNYHEIAPELDIFAEAGYATAYEEIVTFDVLNEGTIMAIEDEYSYIIDGHVNLEFRKERHDYPKINAFYVIKGDLDDLPWYGGVENDSTLNGGKDFLTERTGPPKQENGYKVAIFDTDSFVTKLRASGPPSPDPWKSANVWDTLFPLFVTFLASALAIWLIFFKIDFWYCSFESKK